jgi:UDP-N-acetylmuramyl pentapeptide phosphotransferase/UDP-N-acetylglucosamine-1-phosphate transferase
MRYDRVCDIVILLSLWGYILLGFVRDWREKKRQEKFLRELGL